MSSAHIDSLAQDNCDNWESDRTKFDWDIFH